MKVIFLNALLLFTAAICRADVLLLKSGERVEGSITEKNSDSVKVQMDGMDVRYYRDEIAEINGEAVVQKAAATLTQSINQQTDAYRDFKKEKYYLLDTKDFDTITCKVKVPALEDLLAETKAFLAANKKVEVDENLVEFSITYFKGGGLRIKKPHFDIKPISFNGSEAFLSSDIHISKARLDRQIQGAANLIQALFEEYMAPDNSREKVISFEQSSSGGTKVTVDKSGILYDQVYQDMKRKSDFQSPQIKGHAIDNYRDFDGQLLFTGSAMRAEAPMSSRMNKTSTITYHKLQDFYFPTKIANLIKTEEPGNIKKEEKVDIFFEDCVVE